MPPPYPTAMLTGLGSAGQANYQFWPSPPGPLPQVIAAAVVAVIRRHGFA